MTVSILIPFYQAETYLERCARSVLEQTYPDIEYLFIDDACTDGSVSLLERTLEDYPHRKEQVRILRNERNLGLARCRNLAVQECTGSFLFWVDADDWISPADAIRQLADKQRQTGADIVSASAVRVHQDRQEDFPISSHASQKDTLLGFLDHTVAWAIWGRLIRVSLYRDQGIGCLEGIDYNEDFQVAPRLFYFADTVSEADTAVYHYFEGDPLSYTERSRIDPRIRLKRWQQNLASTRFLREFFRDKLPEADPINEKHIVHYLVLIIHESTRVGDKPAFLEAMEQLKRCDKDIAPAIAKSLWTFARLAPSLCWYLKRLCCRLSDPQFIQ